MIAIIARAMDCIQIEANGACRGRWCNRGRVGPGGWEGGECWWIWGGGTTPSHRGRWGGVSVNAIDENLYQILWIARFDASLALLLLLLLLNVNWGNIYQIQGAALLLSCILILSYSCTDRQCKDKAAAVKCQSQHTKIFTKKIINR